MRSSVIKSRFNVLGPLGLHDGEATLVQLERLRKVPEEQPHPVRSSAGELGCVSILQQVDKVLATGVKRFDAHVHRANVPTSVQIQLEPLPYRFGTARGIESS